MDFDTFARQCGVLLPAHLYPSLKIRRCATVEHPRGKNGAFFYDGERGWVKAWDGDGDTHWWNDPHAKPATPRDRDAMAARQRAEKQRMEAAHARAVARASELLDTCYIEPHPYLSGKGLPDEVGLVTEDYELFVPMRHIDTGRVLGGQLIRHIAEGVDEHGEITRSHFEKKMIYGTRLAGAMFQLGHRWNRETWLCEGYATGLSVLNAIQSMHIDASVVVCFNDWNLVQVAKRLTVGRRFVFADNDKSGAGLRAAKATGLNYCLSPQEGEDANDLHQRAGLLAVANLMMTTRTRRD